MKINDDGTHFIWFEINRNQGVRFIDLVLQIPTGLDQSRRYKLSAYVSFG